MVRHRLKIPPLCDSKVERRAPSEAKMQAQTACETREMVLDTAAASAGEGGSSGRGRPCRGEDRLRDPMRPKPWWPSQKPSLPGGGARPH